jgi:alanine-glyoxylate transaminase/serine-glyoxylate transaminase/serine-pyruvate transaminase
MADKFTKLSRDTGSSNLVAPGQAGSRRYRVSGRIAQPADRAGAAPDLHLTHAKQTATKDESMIGSFHPPARTLMGPGPSDVNPRILEALSRPTIGHLDPAFIDLMNEIKALLQATFRTDNALTLPISAPGSAGMEACFVNLVSPGDKVIVAQNGLFGGRMKENVERSGGIAVMVEDDWGSPVDPQKVEDALKANSDTKAMAFVHAETSTGARSDAAQLCTLAAAHDCLSIVDTVTSLGGIEVDVDGWGADAVYSGT